MSTHNIKKKITLNYPKSAAMVFCSKRLKNQFETAVVNEPSVFEPPKFYYICLWFASIVAIIIAVLFALCRAS